MQKRYTGRNPAEKKLIAHVFNVTLHTYNDIVTRIGR